MLWNGEPVRKWNKKFAIPSIAQTYFCSFIMFNVLKITWLSSWFQCQNLFWKMCTMSKGLMNIWGLYVRRLFKTEFCDETVTSNCLFWEQWANHKEVCKFLNSVYRVFPFKLETWFFFAKSWHLFKCGKQLNLFQIKKIVLTPLI